MNRNQAKEFYPIMQAFAEGRVIECRTKPSAVKGADVPNDWTEMKEIEFWNNIEYRIKQEPKYRQFKDSEECWNEMQKHQPFGWIKDRDGDKTFIGSINSDNSIFTCSSEILFLKELFEDFTFVDGLPFGIKEEEQLWHGQLLINIIVNIFMRKNLKGVIMVFGHKLVWYMMLQSFQKAASRNFSEENLLGMMSQLNLKNNMIFYRFDEIPEDECSSIWNNNNEVIGKEKGVSVYEAHKNINGIYSPVLPVPTNEMAFNDFIKHIAYFNGNKYLVTGDLLDETGTNGEPLIKNVKILRKL